MIDRRGRGRQEGTSPEGAFGGEQREGVPQVEAHLAAKFGEGARARPVSAEHPVADDVIHHVQILSTQHRAPAQSPNTPLKVPMTCKLPCVRHTN